MVTALRAAPFLAAAALGLGCSDATTRGDGGVSGPDGGSDASGDGGFADSGLDGISDGRDEAVDGPPPSGPLTHVVSEIAVVTDRICDLDGDGAADNAIPDLGSPYADLMATFLSTTADGAVETRDLRFVIHAPWISNLAVPEDPGATIIMFVGTDTDVPIFPGDDFSGEEPFYAGPQTLDPCGEPEFFFRDIPIRAGTMHGEMEVLPMPFFTEGFDVVAHGGQIEGTIQPGGTRVDVWTCGYGLIETLGAAPAPIEMDDMTVLEMLLAGGSAAGLTGVPGLAPDVDVDGDGLERFVLDDTGRILSCVDGDGSVLDGRDCWQDERMADGLSVTNRMGTTTASFAGRQPGWEDEVEGECVDGPPERSVFDPP